MLRCYCSVESASPRLALPPACLVVTSGVEDKAAERRIVRGALRVRKAVDEMASALEVRLRGKTAERRLAPGFPTVMALRGSAFVQGHMSAVGAGNDVLTIVLGRALRS